MEQAILEIAKMYFIFEYIIPLVWVIPLFILILVSLRNRRR